MADRGRMTVVLLFTILFLSNPVPACSSFLANYRTLFSLAHSLFTRVATLRESRGDLDGAARARSIAGKLEGFGLWKVMWNVGWDYVRNYSWRHTSSEMLAAFSDFNEILRGLSDFSRLTSDRERVNWMNRNYTTLLRFSKSLFARFRNLFPQSQGPLKEVIETLQKEVVEGDLLKDCLELGSNDLKGLLMVFRDISSKYTSTSSTRTDL